ncbi:LuxR C-terminal-related transcriptional regulator [Nocardia sp. NEAU-G5]|uniref:LuxR C-terminal-related transcriptional regulator n=1 Tax=Nocardia albiluteola TaxID=2842303 RepID=A0ABS6BAX8_9NOCA|nr:LuxR C-terminal-related transcriptional regulator [Nocardia albiluteola]MBU3067298.1 LuxR C-terminal-related transcriptional regulator [Nocardia albiluteola]
MRGNLPFESTRLVGRATLIEHARSLLGSSRQVTLAGPGGVGKSRLSREVGARVGRVFSDGVWWVELADIRDPLLVPLRVGQALGLRDDAASPTDRLLALLADKNLLLILDNCEHLIDAAAELVASIVTATPGVKVLATSREILGVPGEQVMAVPPLELGAGDGGDNEALQLLLDRAGAANAAFAPDAADRQVFEAICRRVDGIPLALELVALRTTVFTPQQILTRLDNVLGLLTAGPRTATWRQKTLDNAIRWSYDLCSVGEQRLWQALSAFSGGCDVRAAEAVTDPGDDAVPTAELLAGLVNKSILTMRTMDSNARYSMLEPVRQFGRRELAASGRAERVVAAHRGYFADLARRGVHAYGTSADWEWLTSVAGEHANIRAALQDGLIHDPVTALEIATDLRPFWQHYRFVSEGLRWVVDALAANPEPTILRARGLAEAASLAALLSERDDAAHLTEAAAQLCGELGTAELDPEIWLCRALVAALDGEVSRAVELCVVAVEHAEQQGKPTLAMEALALRFVSALVTDHPDASTWVTELTVLTSRHGPHMLGGLAWNLAGLDRWRHGDSDAADENFATAIRLFASFGRCVWLASAFEGMAWTAAARDDYTRSATLIGAAESLERSTIRLVDLLTGPIASRNREQVREALGSAAFDGALGAGAAMGLDDAIAYALDGSSMSPPAPRTARPGTISDRASRRPRGDSTALTRRQSEVAELVARGDSNKRIASELVISQRTVETHIEHILVKLGFTSRTEIARWVHTRTP